MFSVHYTCANGVPQCRNVGSGKEGGKVKGERMNRKVKGQHLRAPEIYTTVGGINMQIAHFNRRPYQRDKEQSRRKTEWGRGN